MALVVAAETSREMHSRSSLRWASDGRLPKKTAQEGGGMMSWSVTCLSEVLLSSSLMFNVGSGGLGGGGWFAGAASKLSASCSTWYGVVDCCKREERFVLRDMSENIVNIE